MSSNRLDDSGAVELTGKIMIVSIIVLFVVLIFVFFLHLYAKWFWYRREQDLEGGHRRRRDFAAGHQEGVTVLRRGLDVAFLKTLPVVQFDPKDFKEGLECAVCLSELEEGEKTRILPKCNHGFHLECIDMWFHSHSTCPICRNTVSEQAEISLEHLLQNHQAQQEESPESILNGDSLPTNILFWGDETEVSTLTSQLEEANHHHRQAPALPSEPASSSSLSSSSSSSTSQTNNNRQRPDLVIDIPRQINEDEDQKTPASSRMRSLRRILSSSRRFNIFSPGSVNVEQVTATGSQS